MSRRWTGPEIEYLTGQLGRATKEVVTAFNREFSDRSYDSIQKKIKGLRGALEEVQNEDSVDELMEAALESVSVEAIKLPHVTAAEKRDARVDLEGWLRDLVDVGRREISHIGDVIASRAVRSDNTSLVVVLSDTHFGKHTADFNLEVARKRMLSVPSGIFNQPLPVIDEVVVVLAGDMVEGEDIYATQNNHIECPVFEQMQHCTRAIWDMVLLFRQLFNCRVRVETVPGNHGRMSKTANEKTNWDNVVYYTLLTIASLHGDPEIAINANFDQFVNFQVKDKVGMAFHKGVKHTGTPAMQLKIAGWARSKNFDFMVQGHWHEWKVGNWLGKFVMFNGCMCGPDDLAEQMGKEDDARQGYFFVTPEKPVWGFSFVEWPTKYING